jgi:hypothetical protein
VAYTTQFRRLLEKTMKRRIDSVLRLIIPQPGPPQKFNEKVKTRLQEEILSAASQILVRKRARHELKKLVDRRRLRFIKGHGIDDRHDKLVEWAAKNLKRPIVYSFWGGKKCLYVGKGKNWKRLQAYKKSIYLKCADRLKALLVKTKSRLPSAECLVIHLHEPRYNAVKAAKVKWGKKCPICERHDELKDELDSLLRLRA